MSRTIHVTVSYSVHVEDDKMSDHDAREYAENAFDTDGNMFDWTSVVFDKWKEPVAKPIRGKGSY